MSHNTRTLYAKIRAKQTFIFGPCVIESAKLLNQIAAVIQKLQQQNDAVFIFKASFDKANRTSIHSFRGPGLEDGLELLSEVKKDFGLAVTTDIHEPWQAEKVAEVVDIIQIPAFLCRQTDLLLAAGKTGKIVNIKKAQFLSGEDMLHPLEKVRSTDNPNIIVTERGTMFGYNNLVVDFRNIPIMKELGIPIVMDCTHSVQRPGGLGGKTGGNREYVPYMAKAAQAFGAKAFFMETHPNPDKAKSDGPNMISLDSLDKVVRDILNV